MIMIMQLQVSITWLIEIIMHYSYIEIRNERIILKI